MVGLTVNDAINRYESDVMPALKSSQSRKRQLDWWREQIGNVLLEDLRPATISEVLFRAALDRYLLDKAAYDIELQSHEGASRTASKGKDRAAIKNALKRIGSVPAPPLKPLPGRQSDHRGNP